MEVRFVEKAGTVLKFLISVEESALTGPEGAVPLSLLREAYAAAEGSVPQRREADNGSFEDTDDGREQREALLEKLADQAGITVPPEQLEAETEENLLLYTQQMKCSAMQTGDLQFLWEDQTQLRKRVKVETARTIKIDLLLKKTVQSHNLTVSAAELEAEARRIALREQLSLDEVKTFLGEGFGSLREDLLMRKALEILCPGTSSAFPQDA